MRLTEEKLRAMWRMRKQIFNNPANQRIKDRYSFISDLFKVIVNSDAPTYDNDKGCYVFNNIDILFRDGVKPSEEYFSCKYDEITSNVAYEGVNNMKKRLPADFGEIIVNVGCMLGGFSESSDHKMVDEYRIISNAITRHDDNGTLDSRGENRHPSSHFADNNYFFNVISTIKEIQNNAFEYGSTKLVLRWPTPYYYKDGDDAAKNSQKKTLRYRFPYKFFYMWTHDVLHPVSLLAYKNLVRQERPLQYTSDICMNQDFDAFKDEWAKYSESIKMMISEEERKDVNFWDEMSMLISIIMIQDQQVKNAQDLLEKGNKAIILYGPPGTGKTFNAKGLVCDELGIEEEKLEDYKYDENVPLKEEGTWTLVQFHPNYTYEDFIGGISPCLTGNTLAYTLKTGIFKKLCDEAAKEVNNEKKFIIIIDEINRADLSSVFGELMYALEYRNEAVSIPNFEEKFIIPDNVYIIGTMNSIDKSLVTFDLALRRRFGFIKIMPDLSVLENILSDYNIDETHLVNYIERCKQLNQQIAKPNSKLQLGPDYQIGQAYFGKIKDFLNKTTVKDKPQCISTFELEKLWNYHLEPLLAEFLGNRIDDVEVIKCMKEQEDKFCQPL